ncbi:histidine phosphatase family protein [Microlunatus speluncae]|uniref:histidine phosphatase family protein n=1 Tax=Microlunatus speluncae TaxID=2594267 RepID=UPI0012667211|nr:histidine phosphatase family protein [Microlunatus speluncae]
MKDAYVVTHPEATHHVDGLVGGWFDSELTDRGVAQAGAIAGALAERIGAAEVQVFSSDLRRARRAAEIITERFGAELIIDPDLRERSFGAAGGRPDAWLAERLVPLPEGADRMQHDEGIDGAETRIEAARRAYAAMQRIHDSPGEHQVVVTHGGVASYLLASWLGMPLDSLRLVHFKVSSGGISLLRDQDDFRCHQLTFLNETSHLSQHP